MGALNLELGKSYVSREGNLVTIIEMSEDDPYPFWGNNQENFASNGQVYNTYESSGDLVVEASPVNKPSPPTKASEFLSKASSLMAERGKQYDADDNQEERSMGKAVGSFNVITGHNLTESDGWLLMQQLKDVRQWAVETYHQDSAEDCVAYSALKAEALAEGK
ncbi:hypothetical protein THIOSC13_1200001 [uncultured Thiomicrorhabdus sp.]